MCLCPGLGPGHSPVVLSPHTVTYRPSSGCEESAFPAVPIRLASPGPGPSLLSEVPALPMARAGFRNHAQSNGQATCVQGSAAQGWGPSEWPHLRP